MPQRNTGGDLLAATVGVIGLLAVVALASGASPFRTHPGPTPHRVAPPVAATAGTGPSGGITWLLPALLILAAVLMVVVAVLRPRGPARAGDRRRRRWVALLLVPAAIALRPALEHRRATSRPAPGAHRAPTLSAPKLAIGAHPGSAVAWDYVLALILVTTLALGLRAVARTRRGGAPEGDDDQPEPSTEPSGSAARASASASRAVALSLHQLRTLTDPRAAVVAAYQAMTSTLAGEGLGPRPAETAYEHLARVLPEAPAGQAALSCLADRFAVARFSAHPVTEDDREIAIDALVQVRDAFGAADRGRR